MTPLQMVAMGFVIVLLDPYYFEYDALPDFAGWLLALAGVRGLRTRLGPRYTGLLYSGIITLLVSVITFVPSVAASVSPSAGWSLSLPQLVFMWLLGAAIADLAGAGEPVDTATAGRFRRLQWAVLVVGVVPLLVLGGGLERLIPVAALMAVGVMVFFIFALFRISKRDYVLPLPND